MAQMEFTADSQASAVDLAQTLKSLNRGIVEIIFRPPNGYVVRVTTNDLSSGGQIPTPSPVTPEPQSGPQQPSQKASVEIAWGKVVGTDFKQRVISIAQNIGCDPSYLMASMAFETGETFSPSIVNKTSGATGLIQFMPKTAAILGVTTGELALMNAIQQLDYVARYFAPFKGKLSALSDVYMVILWPSAVGQSDSHVLFTSGTVQYAENSGLDTNQDGQVTKAEAASKVQALLEKGMSANLRA